MAAFKINHKKKHVLKRELPLHMMLIPGIIFTFIFCYIPMAGMVIAFQKFIPAKGLFGDQKWIGLDNFTSHQHAGSDVSLKKYRCHGFF